MQLVSRSQALGDVRVKGVRLEMLEVLKMLEDRSASRVFRLERSLGCSTAGPLGARPTILPDWLAPSGHYSLHCRKQAWERMKHRHADRR
jgi:hypothetical protein